MKMKAVINDQIMTLLPDQNTPPEQVAFYKDS